MSSRLVRGDKAAVGVCWSRDAVYVEEIVNKAESEMYESKKQYYKKGCRERSAPFLKIMVYWIPIPPYRLRTRM